MLSKKYYKVLANLIGKAEDLLEFQKNLINFLAQDDPKFDKTRFVNAIIKIEEETQDVE
jgi:hypothetical protein